MFTHLIISITAVFFINLLFKKEDKKESHWSALTTYCQLECMGFKRETELTMRSLKGLNSATLKDPMSRSEEWGGLHG